MRQKLIILLLIISTNTFAQKANSLDLEKCVADLNTALVNRDTFRLRILLRDDLHYFHSNGWQQSKTDVMDDLYNGKLTYKKIITSNQSLHFISKDLASVNMTAEIDAVLNSKPMHLSLDVVQMWSWKENRWELFSRLSKREQKQE